MRVKGPDRIYVKLRQLRPNPHRNMPHYPIRPAKVAALVRSIKTNDWWENIEVRPGRERGTYEMAYGHHRWRALEKLFKPDDELGVMVRELTDAQMLRRMADENLELAGGDALVEIETVGAVIAAYAKGQIELSPIPASTPAVHRREVPGVAGKVYTGALIAQFLGWVESDKEPDDRARVAVAAWHAIQDGSLNRADLVRMADENKAVPRQSIEAALVSSQATRRRAEKEAATREIAARGKSPEVQRAAKAAADRIREQGKRDARAKAGQVARRIVQGDKTVREEIAAARRRDPAPKREHVLPIKEWVRRVTGELRQLAITDSFEADLASILRNVDALEADDIEAVADALDDTMAAMKKRWDGYSDRLRATIRRQRLQPARKQLGGGAQ